MTNRVIADPPLARFLFSDTRMAPVWLLIRIYVGWAWLEAGWHKVETVGPGNYIVDGAGILAFWTRIAAIPAAPAKPVITYDWYRGFIQLLIDNHAEVVMGKVIAFGETAVGVGLILGAFVGVAAVGGAFMNLNFMLAGSSSTNPVMLLLASSSSSRGRLLVTSVWIDSFYRCSGLRGAATKTKSRSALASLRHAPRRSDARLDLAASPSAGAPVRASRTLRCHGQSTSVARRGDDAQARPRDHRRDRRSTDAPVGRDADRRRAVTGRARVSFAGTRTRGWASLRSAPRAPRGRRTSVHGPQRAPGLLRVHPRLRHVALGAR
jgi:thiosulfate dehydrogenase [quinone] large subunit